MPPKHRAGTEHTARSYDKFRQETYQQRALEVSRRESDARPERPRIQPSEVDYIRKAVDAPDVETFLSLI